MKKTFKKSLALFIAIISLFTLSLTAFAADITADRAKEIALSDAGYTADRVKLLVAHGDFDDGIAIWSVDFYAEGENGYILEFDYEIAKADGRIIEKDVDIEKRLSLGGNTGTEADIGLDAAKQIAVAEFQLAIADVEFLEIKKEYDDGILVYDIEFHQGYDAKYSVEIAAADGRVLDRDKDICNTFGDKIELFFEILFFNLFSIFNK